MNFPCKPFTVPNFVLLDKPEKKPRRNTVVSLPAMPLSEVTEKELRDLCVEFRKEIFRRAGKTDPDQRSVDEDWKEATALAELWCQSQGEMRERYIYAYRAGYLKAKRDGKAP